MRLLDPNGVRVSVPDEMGEGFLSRGYTLEGAADKAAPSSAPDKAVDGPESEPKRRPRPRKVVTPDND